MPYASRLIDSAVIARPTITQSNIGQRKVGSYSTVASAVSCQLQLRNVDAVLREFGLDSQAVALLFFMEGQDIRPRIGDSSEALRDRVTVTQQNGDVSTWQVEGVKHLPGHVVAAVSHTASAARTD